MKPQPIDAREMQRKFTRMMLFVYYHWCYRTRDEAEYQAGFDAINLLAKVAALHPAPRAARTPGEIVGSIIQSVIEEKTQ